MAPQADPYRTLGLVPGASLNEIRSAYRRLVKQYHPDAAGDRAVARFLAIQAAYERLVDGEGRLRRPGNGDGAGGDRETEPWRADPERARATRDAWRRRRGRAADGTGGAAWEAAGARRASRPPGRPAPPREGEPLGEDRPRGRDAPGEGAAPGSGAPPRDGRQQRGPRKATPGSTTYDEAAQTPRNPEWDGSAWYGPSSRTYWTLNPREYADPRKHGPEYLARARRAAEMDAGATAAAGRPPAPEPSPQTDTEGAGGAWRWSGAGRTTTAGGSAEWGTRAWSYEDERDGTTWSPGPTARVRQENGPHGVATEQPPPLPDLEALARRASPRSLRAAAARSGIRGRLLLALVGWPPIGYAAGALISTIDGCAAYSTACTGPIQQVPLAVQPLVVAALFLVPSAAAAAAFASIVALAVALPIAAVLSVGTLPDSRVGAPVLGVLTAIAYLVALTAGTLALWRSRPGAEPAAPPP